MEVKEITVLLKEAEKIFEIIEKSIAEQEDIQIFIEDEFIEEFKNNGSKHKVSKLYGMWQYDYSRCKGEEFWYGHKDISISFVSHCDGYYQVLRVPKIKDSLGNTYNSYLKGFEELLLIKVDNTDINS